MSRTLCTKPFSVMAILIDSVASNLLQQDFKKTWKVVGSTGEYEF